MHHGLETGAARRSCPKSIWSAAARKPDPLDDGDAGESFNVRFRRLKYRDDS